MCDGGSFCSDGKCNLYTRQVVVYFRFSGYFQYVGGIVYGVCEEAQFIEKRYVAASCGDGRMYDLGWMYGLAWMVGQLCTSGGVSADPGVDGDRVKDPVPLSERVYDLLCDGIGVQYGSSIYPADYGGDLIPGFGSVVCGIEFSFSCGAYFI